MSKRLFQDELGYLRDVGREMARLNPKLAPYFANHSTDADVERLLQGFAFLTSRLRARIDDEMSDFTHSLLSLIYPNFLRPFPPTTMIKFTPIERSITQRQIIQAGGKILSRTFPKLSHSFSTTSDCVIYPLEISHVELERSQNTSKLSLGFTTLANQPLQYIELDQLRLTLTGDKVTKQIAYLWIGRHLERATLVTPGGKRKTLDIKRQILPVGFDDLDALLPQRSSTFDSWRLLQEYFAFPDKFYAYDLLGLRNFFADVAEESFCLEFEFKQPVPITTKLDKSNLMLYCVPAVNLFFHSSKRITIRDDQFFYPLTPSSKDEANIEIFSVNEIYSSLEQEAQKQQQKTITGFSYPAYESFIHQSTAKENPHQLYWRLQRQRSFHSRNFEYHLFFVHHNNEPALPQKETLAAHLTCFNPNCHEQLGIGDISLSTDSLPSFVSYKNISKPSKVIYPPSEGAVNWQLISNLAPNFTSLLNRNNIAAILKVYHYGAFYDRQVERETKKRIDAISYFYTEAVDRLFAGRPVRGVKSYMKIRGEAFDNEGELYLFTSVLAHFLSLYATIHSFHELEVLDEATNHLYCWPPKNGCQPLI